MGRARGYACSVKPGLAACGSGTRRVEALERSLPFKAGRGVSKGDASRNAGLPSDAATRPARKAHLRTLTVAGRVQLMAGEQLCQSDKVIHRLLRLGDGENARRAIAPGGDDFALVRAKA